jgi:hypothetical protein
MHTVHGICLRFVEYLFIYLFIESLQSNIFIFFQDARIAYDQRRESKNLVMQMYPPHERNFYDQ